MLNRRRTEPPRLERMRLLGAVCSCERRLLCLGMRAHCTRPPVARQGSRLDCLQLSTSDRAIHLLGKSTVSWFYHCAYETRALSYADTNRNCRIARPLRQVTASRQRRMANRQPSDPQGMLGDGSRNAEPVIAYDRPAHPEIIPALRLGRLRALHWDPAPTA